MLTWVPQQADRNIYLIMEYCAGGDLTNYIKKRGKVEGLEYAPQLGAAVQYYPHPRTGGLAEVVVRSFLRQLGTLLSSGLSIRGSGFGGVGVGLWEGGCGRMGANAFCFLGRSTSVEVPETT